MTDGGGIPDVPDVEMLAESMLLLHGGHDHDDEHHHRAAAPEDVDEDGTVWSRWAKARSFDDDPVRAAEIRAATRRDRERYLKSGLTPVDCRRCGAVVSVKKLGPAYTAVQWNSTAVQQCAHFAELRVDGRDSSRSRACPNLGASIRHAVAEGLLEEMSSAPPPGDGVD